VVKRSKQQVLLSASGSATAIAGCFTAFWLLLELQVLYHRDIWTHSNEWWRPLQRCWGTLEKAAASTAATTGAASGKH
jgi:hypothetical protein